MREIERAEREVTVREWEPWQREVVVGGYDLGFGGWEENQFFFEGEGYVFWKSLEAGNILVGSGQFCGWYIDQNPIILGDILIKIYGIKKRLKKKVKTSKYTTHESNKESREEGTNALPLGDLKFL